MGCLIETLRQFIKIKFQRSLQSYALSKKGFFLLEVEEIRKNLCWIFGCTSVEFVRTHGASNRWISQQILKLSQRKNALEEKPSRPLWNKNVFVDVYQYFLFLSRCLLCMRTFYDARLVHDQSRRRTRPLSWKLAGWESICKVSSSFIFTSCL